MAYKLCWRMVRFTYPWLPLAVILWRIVRSTGSHRQRAQARFWILYSRIKFANWLAIMIELSQPEFWLI